MRCIISQIYFGKNLYISDRYTVHHQESWYCILIIKANECIVSQIYFDKNLYISDRSTVHHQESWYCIFIIKANEMHYFPNLFWQKPLYFGQIYCPSSGVLILYFYNKSQWDALFLKFISVKTSIFRTDLMSIIRSLDTVFTAIGICHTMVMLAAC